MGNILVEIKEDLMSMRDSDEGDVAVTRVTTANDEVLEEGLVTGPFLG